MDLSTYELTAINFAKESSNKIHSDEVARGHGFKGALVPGIAVYAYMTRPVVEHLGTDWLERGTITAKFIRPIYEGASVKVCVRRSGSKTNEYEIEILDVGGALCAVGWAGFGAVGAEAPRACDYPHTFLPAPEERMAPRVANLLPGTLLGALEFHPEADDHESKVHDHYLDNLAVYRDPEAVCHPAYFLSQANQILMRNVNLGPWIHTQSRVQNFSLRKTRGKLNIRGSVARSYKKRGHELVDLDLAIFDFQDRGIATVKHSAIIRLKSPELS